MPEEVVNRWVSHSDFFFFLNAQQKGGISELFLSILNTAVMVIEKVTVITRRTWFSCLMKSFESCLFGSSWLTMWRRSIWALIRGLYGYLLYLWNTLEISSSLFHLWAPERIAEFIWILWNRGREFWVVPATQEKWILIWTSHMSK